MHIDAYPIGVQHSTTKIIPRVLARMNEQRPDDNGSGILVADEYVHIAGLIEAIGLQEDSQPARHNVIKLLLRKDFVTVRCRTQHCIRCRI